MAEVIQPAAGQAVITTDKWAHGGYGHRDYGERLGHIDGEVEAVQDTTRDTNNVVGRLDGELRGMDNAVRDTHKESGIINRGVLEAVAEERATHRDVVNNIQDTLSGFGNIYRQAAEVEARVSRDVNKGFGYLGRENEQQFGWLKRQMSEDTRKVEVRMAEDFGQVKREAAEGFGSTKLFMAEAACKTDLLLEKGFWSGERQASEIESRALLEAAKNEHLLEKEIRYTSAGLEKQADKYFAANQLQAQTLFNAASVEAAKYANAATLQAQTNASAAAAQLAACCCELKEKIGEEGQKTRDLMNQIEREREARALVDAKNEILFLKARVPVGTVI